MLYFILYFMCLYALQHCIHYSGMLMQADFLRIYYIYLTHMRCYYMWHAMTGRVHALTGRPVLACGGMFDITETPTGSGVQCVVQSSNPEKTAVAIGERLVAR